MKSNTVLLIFAFIYVSIFSQKITYMNFNSDYLNKMVLSELNTYRKNHSADTMVFSSVLYEQITKKNCEEVSYNLFFKLMVPDSLYHPVQIPNYVIFNTNFKNDLGSESLSKVGGILSIGYPSMKPRMDYSENCFRANDDSTTTHKGFNTYKEIVDLAIRQWENSPSHAEAQLRDYSSQNLPGMFACHSIMTPDGMVYVFVNFVKVYRRSTL
jgi:hypothetical protein